MANLDSTNLSLVTAIAEAKNTDVVLSAVDESLRRSAEARELREKRDAEQRLRDEREARINEFERREERASEELRDRTQREARAAAEREAETNYLRRTVLESYTSSGRLDIAL